MKVSRMGRNHPSNNRVCPFLEELSSFEKVPFEMGRPNGQNSQRCRRLSGEDRAGDQAPQHIRQTVYGLFAVKLLIAMAP
jgi:hypothetical protein